jgi:hypothetical protein
MAVEQQKKINLKLVNDMSSGDYINNEIQKINENTKPSMESKIVDKEDDIIDIQTGLETPDDESAYEESFYSDHSDDTEFTSIRCYPVLTEIPLFQFTNTKSPVTKQSSLNSNNLPSMSNISDQTDALEDKVKYLSLHEAQPIKSMQSRSFRKNMSFSNNEIMKIERDNEFLLRKIMSQQSPQKIRTPVLQTKLCSSAINRKRLQKRIEEDNIVCHLY